MEATRLTPREKEVIELTAYGLSQDEVACHLEISRHTVDELLRRSKRKLGLQKATELTAWYYTRKYHIQLQLSDKLRRLVSAALLGLAMFALIAEHTEMIRTMRTPLRAANGRAARGRRGRRNEFDYELTEDDLYLISA